MDHSQLMKKYAELLRQIKKLEQEVEFLKQVEEDRAKKAGWKGEDLKDEETVEWEKKQRAKKE